MSKNLNRRPTPVLPLVALLLALALAPTLSAGEKAMKHKHDFKPKAIHKVMAEYPEEAREARTEGTVVAYMMIETDGTVSSVKIQEGAEVFHQVTIEALEQWKFEPMETAVHFNLTVNFKLDGDGKDA
jgi:TonB family protein